MATFLNQVAREILSKHIRLQDTAIVLPSRRAAVFLKEELSLLLSAPVWSPHITTSEDFVLEQLGWELADRPTLIFKLYESYCAVTPEESRDSFTDFSHWAMLLLADFNEIDRYLIDQDQLFSYLADVERIKKWDLSGGEMTEMVKNYLKMWESLPLVYSDFTAKLRREARVYQGMAYREMSSVLSKHLPQIKEKYQKLLFVGFNALNRAEEAILSELYREGLAEFYWDIDRYYYNDTDQEAGNFLRSSRLVRELAEKGDLKWLSDNLGSESKKIRICSANGNQQQALIANKLIAEAGHDQQRDTALVMADESLLPLFLNNLSDEIDSLNITMGLPLKESGMSGFFKILMNMLREQEQNSRADKEGNPSFHHRWWTDLFGNNLCKLWVDQPEGLMEIQEAIVRQNHLFLSVTEIEKLKPGVLGLHLRQFFEQLHQSDLPGAWLLLAGLAEQLYHNAAGELALPQTLYGFYKVFNRLAQLMQEYPYVNDWQTALRFYQELIGAESLDITGDPLSGLQVMGMLETRTLDFSRVVITSLNEDILPQGRSENSLVPFEIRREFGLPTYLDKDAVFAYHFYRLLQRAEEVTLIYNSATGGLISGEPSRFIQQLLFELSQRNQQVDISQEEWYFPVPQNRDETIPKTPSVMKSLSDRAEKGLSPTALIDYINDPTEFYRKRLLNLGEADEVEEVAGFDTQGNVIHQLLEEYYAPLLEVNGGPEVLPPDLPVYDLQRSDLRQAIENRLRQLSGIGDFSSGKNLIIREILTGMTARFLRAESEELRDLAQRGSIIRLKGLEKQYEAELVLSDGKTVKIHGNIDRIDELDGVLRIIDYKTGAVKANDLKVKSWDELRQPKDGNKSLQLMVYAWLFLKNNPEVDAVRAGIISLRDTASWLMLCKLNKSELISRAMLEEFEAFLRQLVEEIFDPGQPFQKIPVTLQSDE